MSFSLNELIAILIGLYGAILSTIVYINSRVKIKISLLRGMTLVGTNTTSDYFKITNKAKESIYVETIAIQSLGQKKSERGILIGSNSIKEIPGYRTQLYESERGFDLSNLKTVKVFTGHGKCYTKHFVPIWKRLLNKINFISLS